MNKLLASLLIIISAFSTAAAQSGESQQFFELPIVPDSIQNLQNRCDYMVTHYWDFCDLKKAFSSRDKMADAFDMYLSFMPYASATTVFKSVDNFIKKISKKPDDVLFVAKLAEGKLYSDSAEYQSEQLYHHFIDGLLKTKKLDKSVRPYYEKQARMLANSQEGMKAPSFDYITLDGTRAQFAVNPENFATLLMFVAPGNSDSDMAKLRLSADIKTSDLVESGKVRIVCIAVDKGDTPLSANKGWTMGYADNIDEIYDVRVTPMFYILDSEGTILKKGNDVNPVLNVMQLLQVPRKKSATTPAGAEPQQ